MALAGNLYLFGIGAPRDKAEALRLLRESADHGSWYGLLLLVGEQKELELDRAEVEKLFFKLNNLDNADASAAVSVAYAGGIAGLIERNGQKAAEYMISALKKGSEFASVAYEVPNADYMMELQRLLSSEGLYRGPLDGKDSPELEAAVKALYERHKSSG